MRRPGLTTQIFIALVLGVAMGALWPQQGVAIHPLADLFLRMIKMIIAPLIFSTLVVGIAGAGDLRAVGRIGLKAIVWFEFATTMALVIGLVVVNVLQPGVGLATPAAPDVSQVATMATQQQSGWDFLLHIVPTSVVDAMARGDVLQVVIFSVFFGVALGALGARGTALVSVLDIVAHAMFRVTAYVMWFAPIGVFAAMASAVGTHGLRVLVSFAKLIGTMYLGYGLFVLVVLGVASLFTRVRVGAFITAIREPFLIAFSTASSEAALPKALEAMERFGVPGRIAGFVLPTGYSFNMDGGTLYLSAASIFVAQLAGIHLSVGQQVIMMLTLMLTSKGIAGVPRGSLVVLAAAVSTFNLPMAGVALLLGIDQVLDMGRTAVNVLGNCLASVVVARWEGEFEVRDGRRLEP
jgi:proton glutamate symport protein